MSGELPDPLFLELQTAIAGRYSLERELGRGGMSVVYLARDVTLDRLVAIKLLPPALANLPGVRQRFLREARTAARLSHPNIVAIHAVEETGGLVFFVMAYVPGQTLGERIRGSGPLPASEAARILREVAWALDYAHQQGVVHRDIKAENILLDPGNRRALVADFGIAASMGDKEERIAGTVPYMSPEQASADPVDGRSDLYSLGVLGYLTISGTLPYPVDTIEQLLLKQAAGPPTSLTAAAPHAPRALCRAIDRCLSHQPDGRFQTAGELAAALDQLGAGPTELPVPLRVWLSRDERTRTFIGVWSAVWGIISLAFIVSALNRFPGPALVFILIPAVLGAAPWALFAVARLLRTRRVLAAGFTLNDLILALKSHADRSREELAFEIGKPPTTLGRWLRKITWTSLGVVIAFPILPWFGRGPLAAVWFAAAGLAIGGSMLGLVIPGRVLPPKARKTWRERLWSSSLGRVLVKLAGWRLGRRAAPEHTLHRPTEIALGEAADALFRALPPDHRRELAELPEQIAMLSRQAQYLRRQIDELDDLIAQAAPSTLFDGTRAQGDGGAGALTDTRNSIAGQLTDTVALLESLRVGLLKLHAGSITPESIATQLAMARQLNTRLGELASAHVELAGYLHQEPPTPVSSSAG